VGRQSMPSRLPPASPRARQRIEADDHRSSGDTDQN
jgi:hypothetical protein